MDGANGIRFNSARKRGAFTSGSPFNSTLAASASESLLRIPKTDINPNKAVFTIDSKTSNILIVNNNACQLLGYRPSELCDMKFATLLTSKTNKSYVSALAEGQLNSEDGTMVLLSGKVVEMNTKTGGKVAASLWIRQIDADGRCLAVAEPVERRVTQITIDKTGTIVSADTETLMLFQIDSEDDLIGMGIEFFIPAIKLPEIDKKSLFKAMVKQKATGRTKDSLSFPLCLMITPIENVTTNSNDTISIEHFLVTIWVFQNISGLIVIDESGSIELCNHHFSMLMFGYAQQKIVCMHITQLVPNFGKDFEYLGANRSRNVTASSLDNVENEESETETDPVYYEADQSFYATPTGMMTSDFSKSNYSVRNVTEMANDSNTNKPNSMCESLEPATPSPLPPPPPPPPSAPSPHRTDERRIYEPRCDITKAFSEPIQICLDDLDSNDSQSNDEYLMESDKTNKVESKSITAKVNKSISENVLTVNSTVNDNKFLNRRADTQAIIARSCHEPVDELKPYDATELLTPVNEKHISYKNLTTFNDAMESIPNNCTNHIYRTDELSDALRDIENDLSSDFSIVNADCIEMDTDNRNCSKPLTNNSQALAKSAPVGRRHSEYVSNATQQITSQQNLYNDGKYKGEAIHCDGNVINILYTISSQELPCGRTVYCVWICRDEFDADEEDEKHPNLATFNSITSNVETSVDGIPAKRNSVNMSGVVGGGGGGGGAGGGVGGGGGGATAAIQSSRPNSVSLLSQCEDEQISGEYNKHYTTLKQIGKGAFGYVKMAFRHTDRLLVVTKFILKEKLPPQFMVITDDQKDVPMEVYLLSTIKHPNIVNVLDVFENEKFFQLVMEKHGSGMDLFEFIDRRPLMDEQLGSYIFRQIANAVDYLHSLNILHRDIKDENIIIDQYFHVKLIDFGSATFMEKDKLFATFYGTTEYCSPEVLAGNKYAGPELEIWSLGVTLFVLIFFENPFIDIEETLHSDLVIPHTVSGALENILKSMLDKSPKTRCTMKELIGDPWLTQDLSPCNFNFSWIVPCESHESNPDKYFNGQIYSSATGLSITSPHDSLSLADEEDSMIDAEEDIEDEELCDDAYNMHFKQELDYRKRRKYSANPPNLSKYFIFIGISISRFLTPKQVNPAKRVVAIWTL